MGCTKEKISEMEAAEAGESAVDPLVMVMRESGQWIGSPDFWATVECGLAERIHRELNITIDRCIELAENIANSNSDFFGCICEKEIRLELIKLKRP